MERFVGQDRHANDPWRKALYLVAGLYAFHPEHRKGEPLASALGRQARTRESASIEQRFVALLSAEAETLPHMLRQVVSLLAADNLPCDFVGLMDDMGTWFRPYDTEGRDRLRQRWAREFYRAYDLQPESAEPESIAVTENTSDS